MDYPRIKLRGPLFETATCLFHACFAVIREPSVMRLVLFFLALKGLAVKRSYES